MCLSSIMLLPNDLGMSPWKLPNLGFTQSSKLSQETRGHFPGQTLLNHRRGLLSSLVGALRQRSQHGSSLKSLHVLSLFGACIHVIQGTKDEISGSCFKIQIPPTALGCGAAEASPKSHKECLLCAKGRFPGLLSKMIIRPLFQAPPSLVAAGLPSRRGRFLLGCWVEQKQREPGSGRKDFSGGAGSGGEND